MPRKQPRKRLQLFLALPRIYEISTHSFTSMSSWKSTRRAFRFCTPCSTGPRSKYRLNTVCRAAFNKVFMQKIFVAYPTTKTRNPTQSAFKRQAKLWDWNHFWSARISFNDNPSILSSSHSPVGVGHSGPLQEVLHNFQNTNVPLQNPRTSHLSQPLPNIPSVSAPSEHPTCLSPFRIPQLPSMSGSLMKPFRPRTSHLSQPLPNPTTPIHVRIVGIPPVSAPSESRNSHPCPDR